MTAWVKDNTVSISLVVFVCFVVAVVTITLSYAEKESKQTSEISRNNTLIEQNSRDISKLTQLVESHIKRVEAETKASGKMQSDVEHIKADIAEIKKLLDR